MGEIGNDIRVPGVPMPNFLPPYLPRSKKTGLSLVIKAGAVAKITPQRREKSRSANDGAKVGIWRSQSVRTASGSVEANSRISAAET